MTEFEQQVADALGCVSEDFVDGTGTVWVKRDEVAPRVVAAMYAMAGDMGSEKDALAALRGD